MRYFLTIICGLCTAMLFSQDFIVDHAQVDIVISNKGYFDVVEKYDVTFFAEKHGIFRFIQTKYELENEFGNKESHRIKIKDIEVPGHKFDKDFDFLQDVNKFVEIKIGDPNKTIIGNQHYEIKYRVFDAFLFESEATSFYWNIKANNWKEPFKSIGFTIHMPENAPVGMDDFFIYSGEVGSTNPSNEFDFQFENGVFKANSKPEIVSEWGMSVTALVKFPPGYIAKYEPPFPIFTKFGWTMPLGLMGLLFFFVWNKFGKDDKVIAVTSYYPPPGINSAMAGFLIDDSIDSRDLISFIPQWGAQGLLKIEEIPKGGWFRSKDTKIYKLKDIPADRPGYEKIMFNGLFDIGDGYEVLVSELKNVFYTTLNSTKAILKQKAQIYYDATARRVMRYTIVGIILFSALLFFVHLYIWGLVAALAVIPAMVILLLLSRFLIKKNSKGNEILQELKGFKKFIEIAEENQLRMLMKENPNYFETTMAYAVAFGIFDKWAKKFEAMNVAPPTWYSSPSGIYSMSAFSKSFSSTISSAQTQMVSSPSSSSSSSGGGSSGGGFGGGGGGSW